MKLPERIREYRKSKKLTQKELADLVNVSPQVISNWERNYTTPDSEDLARLAKVFGISSDDLLGIPNNKDEIDVDESFTKEELTVLNRIKRDPNVSVFFKDFASAPVEKQKELIRFWQFLNANHESK